jgi:hypothetical protein
MFSPFILTEALGGIYSDIDVVLTTDIRQWLHNYGFTLDISELDFVFGIEFDRKTKSHNAEFDEEAGKEALVEIPFQLTQWCFTGMNLFVLFCLVLLFCCFVLFCFVCLVCFVFCVVAFFVLSCFCFVLFCLFSLFFVLFVALFCLICLVCFPF